MTHYRNTPGIAVAICGERGLGLKFSVKRNLIDCQPCLERHAAGATKRIAMFVRLKVLHARRR